MDGKGILRSLGGDIYSGDFKNGFKHGQGRLVHGRSNGWYEGTFHYNKKEGSGVSVDSTGNRYEGVFLGNMRHGEGSCTYAETGARYAGTWQNNLPYKGRL